MTDRELLEKAAKAAGYKVYDWLPNLGFAIDVPWKHGLSNVDRWNPFTDDGDALRLAVKLHVELEHNQPQDQHLYVAAFRCGCEMLYAPVNSVEELEDEPQRPAATRRAIVRAAAAIGEKT